MSDNFISYSKSDRAKAKVLAKALGREGWSVWWDPKIPPGKTFDEVIEQALDSAKCVVVLWSKKSVTSDWVKTEAGEGKRRGILIPALVEDDVKIPLDFRRLHASRLADWNGEESGHLEFEELKNAVAVLLGGATSVAESSSNPSLSGVPVEATSERTPSNEKVSEKVQADPKRPQSQVKRNVWEIRFGSKILPARVMLFVLAGIVAVVVALYAWRHLWKASSNAGEPIAVSQGETTNAEPQKKERPKNQPVESRPELSKNQGSASQGETTKVEPQEQKERPTNQPVENPPVEQSLVYLDSTTGFSWTKSDNGRSVTWFQANQYCQSLWLSGYSDWRLPTIEELEKLYDPKVGGGHKIRKPFDLTACCPWSSSKAGSATAWVFHFSYGERTPDSLVSSYNSPALCVRGPGE